MKVKFKENRILFGQDCAYYRGIPEGVEFTVSRVNKDVLKLTACGFGGNPYGNGALFVYESQMPEIAGFDKR